MKNRILAAIVISGLLGVFSILQAKERQPQIHPTEHDPEKHAIRLIQQMKVRLGISEEQEKELRSVLDERTTKIQELRKEFKEKRKVVQDHFEEKIASHLTDEQKEKYARITQDLEKRRTLEEERRQKRRKNEERRGGRRRRRR